MNRTGWLVLVPTEKELQLLKFEAGTTVEICGFGPIAAAARTAGLIHRHNPERVLLIGIAGGYGNRIPVGEARLFSVVKSVGIGIGCGKSHVAAERSGWLQVAESGIGDQLTLARENPNDQNLLLTVCSAAANEHEAMGRLQVYPDAVAEDMEGFGVALAASLANIPVQIVRGISNVAGDRDHSNWRIEDALESAGKLAHSIIYHE